MRHQTVDNTAGPDPGELLDWEACKVPPPARDESPPSPKSGMPIFGDVGPGSFFQGASNFDVEQANVNQHIENLKVVTTINHCCGWGTVGDESRSISLQASRTAACPRCGSSSSQIVTTVNTPSHQVSFEFGQREADLDHREKEVQQRELELELTLREASLERRELAIFAKERAIEDPTASADLIAIFGLEGSKGVVHVLKGFAPFQRQPGTKHGRFVKLHTSFVPHYGALSKSGVAGLSNTTKMTIAKVVKTLYAAQKNSCQRLTFESIRRSLSQLVFLEPRPEHNAMLRRTVNVSGSGAIPGLLTQSQWVVELVDSDTPESVLDSEMLLSAVERKKDRRGCKVVFDDLAYASHPEIDLIDLTVLTLPCGKVPRFKLSHLRVIVKDTGASRQKNLDVILAYKSYAYGLPKGIVLELCPESRSSDCAYTHALFSFP